MISRSLLHKGLANSILLVERLLLEDNVSIAILSKKEGEVGVRQEGKKGGKDREGDIQRETDRQNQTVTETEKERHR